MNNKVHVKKGDTVKILSGKDKGKTGKVLRVIPADRKVVVDGINVATTHVRPKRQGERGGIIKKEIPLYASKVINICPKCNKPTRLGHKFLENGKKVRVCKHCGETL
ncbi:MAG: 50S ribosomal protein L24 [Clostridia bacterium]|nr:50S ribosomal protein L24 [Clostridia bacterium]